MIVYLIISVISAVVECRTFSKIADDLEANGYKANDESYRDTVNAVMILSYALSFVPLFHIALPFICLRRYENVYEAAENLLYNANAIVKASPENDQVPTEDKHEKTSDSILDSKKIFKRLSPGEKARFVRELEDEMSGEEELGRAYKKGSLSSKKPKRD